MPAWDVLLNEFQQQRTDEAKTQWLRDRQQQTIDEVGQLRGGRNVILYGSAFLQRWQAPAGMLQINAEDLNGLMTVIHGMDWERGLTLMLHTPGGVTNAAESLVAYLRSKFDAIEVIVPAFAMSAGTMIALGSDRIIMGRQSQLGPIDPQMPVAGRAVSARAVVDQFERARGEIVGTQAKPGNVQAAHLWAPVLQSVGPALLQEAQNALDYGEAMVAGWLSKYMFAGQDDAQAKGETVARHFNDATTHKSHGRRIDADEAAALGVAVERLEDTPELQEAALTLYHIMTIAFEQSETVKVITTNGGRTWLKNWRDPQLQQLEAARQQQAPRPPLKGVPPGKGKRKR